VEAFDVSQLAISNARALWMPVHPEISFSVGSIASYTPKRRAYDIVAHYGLLHCLGSQSDMVSAVSKLKAVTSPGGIHIVCALNSRRDGFAEGHPGFRPWLPPHPTYLEMYADWTVLAVSDTDLTESHPPHFIEHTHAVTRFYALRPS
jgi:tellurite methyltransferase